MKRFEIKGKINKKVFDSKRCYVLNIDEIVHILNMYDNRISELEHLLYEKYIYE